MPKYDKETLMQMRVIEVESRIKDLKRAHNHFSEWSKNASVRIKTLEDARQRQIELNKEFLQQSLEAQKVSDLSFWDRLFK